MPKYRIAETLRVEFICEADNLEQANSKYLKEFKSTMGVNHKIFVIDGSDYTQMKEDSNGCWDEVCESDET